MNRELVQKWLDALRSGEYGQGKTMLKIPGVNKYCCLGVAAEACFNTNWDGGFPSWGDYIETQASLSDEDVEQLGLNARLSYEQRGNIADSIGTNVNEVPTNALSLAMHLNDTFGASFVTIADVMEEVLLGAEVYA